MQDLSVVVLQTHHCVSFRWCHILMFCVGCSPKAEMSQTDTDAFWVVSDERVYFCRSLCVVRFILDLRNSDMSSIDS